MQTKNSCKLVNELKTDTSGKLEELEAEIDDLATVVDTKATIKDNDTALDSTWSSAKIREEIDNSGGSDVIDDENVSSETTFSSQLISDLVLNTDEYFKKYTGEFSRIENTLQTITTISLTNKMLAGFGVKFNQKDSFSTTTTETLEVQFIGNNSGTVYFTKQYTGSEAFPGGGSAHINITDKFTVDDIDSDDTAIIYKFRCVNAYWSTKCPYTIDLFASPLIDLLN